ncbi:MAG TPA: hypothetical protein VKB56_04270 [Terriglobales bacterium]|nr:hypothetical protein [Terriglobales bacterium]
MTISSRGFRQLIIWAVIIPLVVLAVYRAVTIVPIVVRSVLDAVR